jgi:hypothetical protein
LRYEVVIEVEAEGKDRADAIERMIVLLREFGEHVTPEYFEDGAGGDLLVELDMDRSDDEPLGLVSFWSHKQPEQLEGVFKTVIEEHADGANEDQKVASDR